MRKQLLVLLLLWTALVAGGVSVQAQNPTTLSENFNSITSGIPTGWSSSGTVSALYNWQYNANGYSGGCLRFNSYDASRDLTGVLMTPVLDLSGAGRILSFRYKNPTGGDFQVFVSTDGGSTYATSVTQVLPNSSTWTQVELSITAAAAHSSQVRVVFVATSNYGSGEAYIDLDDVSVTMAPLCARPEGLNLSSLSPTAATLNWALGADGDTPAGYELEVTTAAGVSFFNGSIGAGQSHTLTGLTPATTYNVQLTGDCQSSSSGFSPAATFTFTTPCTASAAPYSENFNASSTLPSCIRGLNISANGTVKTGTSGYSLALTTTTVNDAYVVFPELTLPSDSVETEFQVRASSVTGGGQGYAVGLITDLADLSTFEPLVYDTLRDTQWHTVRFNTMATNNGTQPTAMIGIFVSSGYARSLYVDDVEIYHIPLCVRPENVTASNVTITTATLDWTSTNATTAEAEIVTGTDTTYQTLSANPGVISGLAPNTRYSIRVRGVCAADDRSQWSRTPVEIHTACTADAVAEFSEGFENTNGTSDLPDCWQMGWITAPQDASVPSFQVVSTYHSGTRGIASMRQSAGTVGCLSSPAHTIAAAGTHDVRLWLYRQTDTYTTEGIEVWVNTVANTLAGATQLGFVPRDYRTAPAENTAGWYSYNFPITVAGDLHVLLVSRSAGGNNTYIDDVAIVEHETCARPTGVISVSPASADSMTFSWDAGAASSWTVDYRLRTATTVLLDTTVVTAAPEFVVADMADNTSYYVDATIRALCGVGDTSEAMTLVAYSFTTPCGMVRTFPFSESFESATFPPACWTRGTSGVPGYSGVVPQPQLSTSHPHNGTNCVNFPDQEAQYDSWLTTPLCRFEQGRNYIVSFYMYRGSSYGDKVDEKLHVYVGTDPNDYANAVELGSVAQYYSNAPQEPSAGVYRYEFYIPDTISGARYVIFRYDNQYGIDAYVDDISIESTSSCVKMRATTDSITQTTALLRAVADGRTLTQWQAEYAARGEAAVTATFTDTVASLAGLTSGTYYDVRVRRICAAGDTSDWSEYFTLHTRATTTTVPYSCDFESEAERGQWTVEDPVFGQNHFVAAANSAAACSGSAALYVSNNGSAYSYANNSTSLTIAYRSINFGAEGYRVQYKWRCRGGESNKYDYGRAMLVPAASGLGFSGSSYDYMTYPANAEFLDEDFAKNGYSSLNLKADTSMADVNGWNTASVFVDMTNRPGLYNLVFLWVNDGSGGANPPIAFDDINIFAENCIPPTTVVTTGLTDSSVVINIQQSNVRGWELLLDTLPITASAVTQSPYRLVSDSTGTVSLAGLAPNTHYYYTVRTICQNGDTSFWRDGADFTTYCGIQTLPYSNDFESGSSTDCWKDMNAAGGVSRYTGYKHGGGASMRLATTTAISPQFAVDSLSRHMITGWAYSTADSAEIGVGVMNDPNDLTSFELVSTVMIPVRNTWTEFTAYFTDLDLEEYEDYRYAQYIVLATGNSTVYLDDILVALTPSCPKPTEPRISNVLDRSFDISFTDAAGAQQWMVTVNGAASIITSNPATISGLEPQTSYAVTVRAICGAGDTSLVTDAGNVTTTCGLVNLPYLESFETFSNNYTQNQADNFCWSQLNAAQYASSYPRYAADGSHATDGSKSLKLVASSSNTLYLAMPPMRRPDNVIMTYDVYCESVSSSGQLAVGYMTNTSDASSFVAVEAVPTLTSQQSYETVFRSLPQGARLAFRLTPGRDNYWTWIDNLTVNELRSCSATGAPSVSNITAYSADVVFTDTCAAHTAWQYAAGAPDANPDELTAVNLTDTVFTANGLTPDTDYRLFVRAICGVGDTSVWKTVDFRTLCVPYVVTAAQPFFDGFESGISPCYSLLGQSGSYRVQEKTNTSVYGYAHTGEGCAYLPINKSYCPEGLALGRTFHLVGGQRYAITAYCMAQSYDAVFSFEIGQSEDSLTVLAAQTATYRAIQAVAGYYNYVPGYTSVETYYTAPADGDYFVAVRTRCTDVNNYAYGYIDEFSVSEFSGCAPVAPTLGTVTGTSVTFTVPADSTGVTVYDYMITSGADTVVVPTAATVSPMTVDGLSPLTAYNLYVRSDCGAGVKSDWRLASFRTGCGLVSTYPFTEDFEGFNSGSVPECWDNSSSQTSTITSNASYVFGVFSESGTGNKLLRLYNYYCQRGLAQIETPEFVLDSASRYGIVFNYSNQADCGPLKVSIKGASESTYTTELASYTNTHGSTSYTTMIYHDQAELTIPARYYGDTVRIAFSATANYGSGAIFVDNFTLRELSGCARPETVTCTALGSDSAAFAFDDPVAGHTEWQYAVGAQGFSPDSVAAVSITTDSFVIAGLTPDTHYDLYIRTVCGVGDTSDWLQTDFLTTCEPVVVTMAAPFVDTFEDYANNEKLGQCYATEGVTESNRFRAYTGSAVAYSGTVCMYNYANSGSVPNGMMYARPFVLEAGKVYEASVFGRATSYDAHLSLVYGTEPETVSMTVVAERDYEPCSAVSSSFVGCFEELFGNITVPQTGIYYIGVRTSFVDDGQYFYFYTDNFGVRELPNCVPPRVAPEVGDPTSTTASVTVDLYGKPQAEIGWAPAVQGVTAASIVGSTTTNVATTTVTGLTPSTNYVFFYRLLCEGNDTSVWSPASAALTTFANDCFQPQGLAVVGQVDNSHAAFSWQSAPSTVACQYQVLNGTTVEIDGTTTADSVSIDTLHASTAYTFRVRSLCQGDTSDWTIIAFHTTYDVVDLPFVCGFENAEQNNSWNLYHIQGAANNDFIIGSDVAYEGLNSLYVSDNGATNGYSVNASHSAAELLVRMPAGRTLVSYDWRCQGESSYDYGRAFLMPLDKSVTDMSNLYGLDTINLAAASNRYLNLNATWTHYEREVYVPQTTVMKLVFGWRNDPIDFFTPALAVDNVSLVPVLCDRPQSVAMVSVDTASAAMAVVLNAQHTPLNWGYSTVNDIASVTNWTLDSVFTGDVDTVVMTGLAPNTTYYLFARHICTATDTSAAVSINVKTVSNLSVTVPYVCSFEPGENLGAWSYTNGCTNRFVVGTAVSTDGNRSLYITDDGVNYNYGSLSTSDHSYVYAYIPIVLSESTVYGVSYDWQCNGESTCDFGRVFLAPSSTLFEDCEQQGGLSSGALPLGFIPLDGGNKLNLATGWQSFSSEISLAAGSYYLVAYWQSDYSVQNQPPLAIDNIHIARATCAAISAADVAVIEPLDQHQATLEVTGLGADKRIEYTIWADDQCTDSVAGGVTAAGDSTFTVTGLEAGHWYWARLNALCDSTDRSLVTTVRFRTDCGIRAALPYEESFDGPTMPAATRTALADNCWLTNTYDNTVYAYPQNNSTYAHTGNNGLFINSSTIATTLTFGLPEMSGITGAKFSFYHKKTYGGGTTVYVGYLTDESNLNSFVALDSTAVTTAWTLTEVMLAGAPDTARAAFRIHGVGYTCIDDIRIAAIAAGPVYSDTICHGTGYMQHGFNIAATDIATGDNMFTRVSTATAAGEVDTLYTAHVTMLPEISSTISATICAGTPYVDAAGDWTIDNPQPGRPYMHVYRRATRFGCDSTVYLNLNIIPTSRILRDTICSGGSTTFGDTVITTAGLYVRSYQSAEGLCNVTDSLYVTMVADTVSESHTICEYDLPYIWNGRSLNAAGQYSAVMPGAHGCDQTHLLTLAVLPADSTVNVQFCRGSQAQVADTFISTAGTYTLVRVSAEGCDLTYHITATVTDPQAEQVYDVACEGHPYNGYGIRGLVVTADTVVTINTRTADALCDSVAEIHIEYHATETSEFTVRINEGETYDWNDNTYAVAGDYTGTFQNRYGCDSVVTLHLEVGNGVDNVADRGHIRVVPNPAGAGQAALVFVSGTGEIARVEVINSYGAVVNTWEPCSTPIDLTAPQTAGVYHVRVTTAEGRVYVEKLIVR